MEIRSATEGVILKKIREYSHKGFFIGITPDYELSEDPDFLADKLAHETPTKWMPFIYYTNAEGEWERKDIKGDLNKRHIDEIMPKAFDLCDELLRERTRKLIQKAEIERQKKLVEEWEPLPGPRPRLPFEIEEVKKKKLGPGQSVPGPASRSSNNEGNNSPKPLGPGQSIPGPASRQNP